MESRRKAGRRASSGSIAATPKHAGADATTPNAHIHLQALLDTGGQVLLGTVQPIKGVAVAHDGKKTLAMLKCKPRESLLDLLIRLDAAVATAQATGKRVDEINTASSDKHYSF